MNDVLRALVRIALVQVLLGGLIAPSAALGRSEPPNGSSVSASAADAIPSPAVLPKLAERTVPVRFSVAGPVSPKTTRLVILTGLRSCGVGIREKQYEAVEVTETDAEVAVRLDVAIGPDGTPCTSTSPVRVPVSLAAPLGERTIRDAGTGSGALPLINRADPIDTGFRYSCDGVGSTVADLVGPGLDVSRHGPNSSIPDARAIVNTGDIVEFLGPLRPSGDADWEAWWFHDGRWDRNGWGKCRPQVVLTPGLTGATWSPRGRHADPGSRRIQVSVKSTSCAGGRSPAGRIVRPIVQVRPNSIVIILGIEPLADPQDCQGTPSAPFVVKLPVALGTRALYDGGVFPPKELSRQRR